MSGRATLTRCGFQILLQLTNNPLQKSEQHYDLTDYRWLRCCDENKYEYSGKKRGHNKNESSQFHPPPVGIEVVTGVEDSNKP
jgi:hypothetical protein